MCGLADWCKKAKTKKKHEKSKKRKGFTAINLISAPRKNGSWDLHLAGSCCGSVNRKNVKYLVCIPDLNWSFDAVASVNWNQFDNLPGHTRTHTRLCCAEFMIISRMCDFDWKLTLWGAAPCFYPIARYRPHNSNCINLNANLLPKKNPTNTSPSPKSLWLLLGARPFIKRSSERLVKYGHAKWMRVTVTGQIEYKYFRIIFF